MEYSLAQWYAIGYHDYKCLAENMSDFATFEREDKEDERSWSRGYDQAMEDWKEFDNYRFSKLINV